MKSIRRYLWLIINLQEDRPADGRREDRSPSRPHPEPCISAETVSAPAKSVMRTIGNARKDRTQSVRKAPATADHTDLHRLAVSAGLAETTLRTAVTISRTSRAACLRSAVSADSAEVLDHPAVRRTLTADPRSAPEDRNAPAADCFGSF